MRLSKHQRDTIKKIYEGEIHDIASYLQCFQLGNIVRYDEDKVNNAFLANPVSKTYYWNKQLKRSKVNTLSKEEYMRKIEQEELHPDYYEADSLTLALNYKNHHVEWDGMHYYFDFYTGVYVSKSIEQILDFLALCQYLKAEMLIIEVPCSPSKEALGLFFEKKDISPVEDNTREEPPIHYDTRTVDDSFYLKDDLYEFSEKNCTICRDYVGKKIYPTSRLKLFIDHRFNTAEERSHIAALAAAWIAILVSLCTSLVPYLRDQTDEQLASISKEINQIKTNMEIMMTEPKPHFDLTPISEKTDIVISLLERINENIHDETPSSEETLSPENEEN